MCLTVQKHKCCINIKNLSWNMIPENCVMFLFTVSQILNLIYTWWFQETCPSVKIYFLHSLCIFLSPINYFLLSENFTFHSSLDTKGNNKLVNLRTDTRLYFLHFVLFRLLHFTSEFKTRVLEVKPVYLIFGTDNGVVSLFFVGIKYSEI